MEKDNIKDCNMKDHCMKSHHVRSHFGPHCPAFGLNTERYEYLSVIRPNARRCGPE